MITFVNLRNYRGKCIYVARPSILGNPFVIGKDGDRPMVNRRYRRWLWNELQRGYGPVFDEIHRLARLAKASDLTLGCWCVPQPCHGFIIRDCIEYLNRIQRLRRFALTYCSTGRCSLAAGRRLYSFQFSSTGRKEMFL
jgi:hypothetical protein